MNPCPPGSHLETLPDGSLACVPDVTVGHGGHGGGGHGHGGGRFWGGGWGGWGYGYPYWPIVYACGPGQVLLANGTCANVAVGPVTVGAQVPQGADGWEDGNPVCCGIADDGTITLPDGSTVSAHDLDWSDCMSEGATVGDASMPGAVTQTTGNADVDALNAQYIAIGQVIATNASTAPADLQPAWARDDGQWQAWLTDYNNANVVSKAARRGSLSAWQSIANDWTQAVKAQWPNSASAQNLSGGQASPIDMYPSQPMAPSGGLNVPGIAGTASLLEWIVIATCVGVGLWVLWPVLAGAHGALAAA